MMCADHQNMSALCWRMCSTVNGECVPDMSVIRVIGHDSGKPIEKMPASNNKDSSVDYSLKIKSYFAFYDHVPHGS
jgi:hypothetical protein